MGKSTAMLISLGHLAHYFPDSYIWVLDFKSQDYSFLKGCKRYFSFEETVAGLADYKSAFLARQSGADLTRNYHILVIDEMAAQLSYYQLLDRKLAETMRLDIAQLLMLTRSYAGVILIGMQRPDTTDNFAKGARENINSITALGTLSREARNMFFADYADEIQPAGRGCGYFLTNGQLNRIIVPYPRNMQKLQAAIRRLVD